MRVVLTCAAAALACLLAVCGRPPPDAPGKAGAASAGSSADGARVPPALADLPEAPACAPCHPLVVSKWRTHGMADTLGPVEPERLPAQPDDAWIGQPGSPFGFRVAGDAQGWKLVQMARVPEELPTPRREAPLPMRIGAGVADMSFVASAGGRWTFAPLEHFTGRGWALAPHAFGTQHGGLSKRITRACLQCHTTAPLPDPVPPHAFGDWRPRGLRCSTCHGPVEEHLRRMEADPLQAEVGIAYPGDWPAARQVDLCARCHLEGESHLWLPAEGPDAWSPGDDLLALRPTLVAAEPGDAFAFVSQADRLAASACFRESPRMSCTTCHDPHASPRRQGRASLRAACRDCHPAAHAGAPPPARPDLPPPPGGGEADCISCHMPRAQPHDLAHVRIHDHWIRARPQLPEATFPPQELESPAGDWRVFRFRDDDPGRASAREAEALRGMAFADHGDVAAALSAFAALPAPGTARARHAAPDEPLALLRVPAVHFLRGRALAADGRREEAIAAYGDALLLDPRAADARHNLALLLVEAGALERAREHAARLRREHPGAESTWNLLAEIALAEEDVEGFAAALRESLDRNPGQAAVQQQLGRVWERRGRRRDAHARYRAAWDLDPRLPGLAQDLLRTAPR